MLFFFFKFFKTFFTYFHTNKGMNPKSCILPLITTNNDYAMIPYDFEHPVNHADEDCDVDCELPKELAWLLKQESKFIQSHEELVEVFNLGTKEEAKEVRVGSTLQEEVKAKFVKLLQDYIDVLHGLTKTCQTLILISWSTVYPSKGISLSWSKS